jgi:hypothetical protein
VTRSSIFPLKKKIERSGKRARSAALTIATQSATDCFCIGAMLDGEAKCDGGVARRCVSSAVGFVIREKQLGNVAVSEAANVQV